MNERDSEKRGITKKFKPVEVGSNLKGSDFKAVLLAGDRVTAFYPNQEFSVRIISNHDNEVSVGLALRPRGLFEAVMRDERHFLDYGKCYRVLPTDMRIKVDRRWNAKKVPRVVVSMKSSGNCVYEKEVSEPLEVLRTLVPIEGTFFSAEEFSDGVVVDRYCVRLLRKRHGSVVIGVSQNLKGVYTGREYPLSLDPHLRYKIRDRQTMQDFFIRFVRQREVRAGTVDAYLYVVGNNGRSSVVMARDRGIVLSPPLI